MTNSEAVSTETWSHVVEIAAYLVACVTLYKAGMRYGRDVFVVAVSAMVYSYAVEVTFVWLHGYCYFTHDTNSILGALRELGTAREYTPGDFPECPARHFLVPLPGAVPLWVPVGWGTIVFATTKTANRVGLTWWTRPLAAALLALLLDFALDPIAVQLEFWKWRYPDSFYDVSWGNFTGWLLIVASYSFVVELMYQKCLKEPRPEKAARHREWSIPAVAIFPAYVVCVVAHVVFQVLPAWLFKAYGGIERGWVFVLLFIAFVGLVAYVGSRTRVSRHNPVVWELLAVPVAYLSLFSAIAFLALKEHPELRVWIPLFGCLVVVAFLWPSIEVVSASKGDAISTAKKGHHEILRRLEREAHKEGLAALSPRQRFFADNDTAPSMDRSPAHPSSGAIA